jgi:hypothetical protein
VKVFRMTKSVNAPDIEENVMNECISGNLISVTLEEETFDAVFNRAHELLDRFCCEKDVIGRFDL